MQSTAGDTMANPPRLPWPEIRRRYVNEWVALVDVEAEPQRRIRAGVVFAHHPDRRTLLELQKHLPDAAILWTGETPNLHLRRIDVG